MSAERVTLIDGSGLVYRAWHALPRGLKTTGGLHTNAVFGFAQMFRKILAGKAADVSLKPNDQLILKESLF